MNPRILKINPQEPEENKIRIAAQALRRGKLVIIPTETVYGVAADMRNLEAVGRLYKIKHRPKDKPFTLHICDKKDIEIFAEDLNQAAFKLADKFWPGPLTLVLPAKGGNTVGLRMPDNNIALMLIFSLGAPLVCPSANLSGKAPPVDLFEAMKDLGDKVDMAIDGGATILRGESSVVDLTKTPYNILRQGVLSAEDIDRVLRKKVVLFICTGNSCRSVMAKVYLEKLVKESNRDDIEVISAGILDLPNLGVSSDTREVLEKNGIVVEGHNSSRVNRLMINKSNIILVMEKMQEERILELAPEAKTRLFLLKEFSGVEDNSLDIDDPIGRSIEFHEKTFVLIKEAIDRLVKII
ncbi:MAG: L-threonylcarbamoyladenylate synthase [Candidatus Omnitrophota bacterium]